MARTLFLSGPIAALIMLAASPSRAQPDEGFDKGADDAIAAQNNAEAEKAAGDRMPGERDPSKAQAPAAPEDAAKYDPKELSNRAYYFLSFRFRDIIVPKFMVNIFADGGATVNVFSFGPEFGIRKDGFELDLAVSYADYSMAPFLFKGHDDADDAWERVSSTMKVLYFTVDLLKDVPLDDKGRFSFLVGGGVGLGGVFGQLRRNEIWPKDLDSPNYENPGAWNDCTQSEAEKPTQFLKGTNKPYCGDSGRYAGYSEPSWANGGSKPFLFPWLALPQVGLRFKPIKQFQARADLGFSITGFFFGLSAGYGLP